MTRFLVIANTYTTVELAAYADCTMIAAESLDKQQASKMLMPTLQSLLERTKRSLSDYSFIATNQGPGPFTTLRVVIASINGLSFATKIPLIGIDGLEAFLTEQTDKQFPTTIALLNAFNRDLYFGIQQPENFAYETGYDSLENMIQKIKQLDASTPIRLIGNGVPLYQQELEAALDNRIVIPQPLPQGPSVDALARMALQRWEKEKSLSHQIFPLYLKQHSATLNIRT